MALLHAVYFAVGGVEDSRLVRQKQEAGADLHVGFLSAPKM